MRSLTPESAVDQVDPAGAVAFSFAFQPIVDTVARRIFSYEALVRGPTGESAAHVLAQARARGLHHFDRRGRIVAIELAAELGIDTWLNVNCLPLSLLDTDASVRALRDVCENCAFPVEHLILEVTEEEVIEDRRHFALRVDRFRASGMKIAIDDFGAGYSGLNLLADYQPDYLKLDMNLVRGIEGHGPRQAIVRAIGQACGDLGIDVIAEGVETLDEFAWFHDEGVHLFQGFLFARPAFEALLPARIPVAL